MSEPELPGRPTAPQPMMGPDLSDAAVQSGAGGRVSTKPETNERAVAAVKRWMIKHGYSTGGSDNIEFMLTNLEGQMRERTKDSCKNKGGDVGAAGECLVCNAEAGEVCRR